MPPPQTPQAYQSPDTTLPSGPEEGFNFVKSLYSTLLNHWEVKFEPTLPITQKELTKAISAKAKKDSNRRPEQEITPSTEQYRDYLQQDLQDLLDLCM